jgi:hypothetical protein
MVGGCLQATTACVGQTNPATPSLKYHIVYADGSVEDNTIIAATAGPTLLCNSNGNWVDTSNSKVVSQFFCYETVTASGCVACTSQTSTTIFSDINVPLYNVSSASPNRKQRDFFVRVERFSGKIKHFVTCRMLQPASIRCIKHDRLAVDACRQRDTVECRIDRYGQLFEHEFKSTVRLWILYLSNDIATLLVRK